MGKKKQTMYELRDKINNLKKEAEAMKKENAEVIGQKFLTFLENDMKGFELEKFTNDCKKHVGMKDSHNVI